MGITRKAICDIVLQKLAVLYPEPISLIHVNNTFELLIACILSAQTTDEQVNNISDSLFHQYPNATALAQAVQADVEAIIRSTGFYRRKAMLIIQAAKHLQEHHGGSIPDTMDALVSIPGIGRKCASLVLSQGLGQPAMIVDRHCARVAERIGLSEHAVAHPDRVEADLTSSIAKEQWSKASMLLNYHGRYCCKSKQPECERCPLQAVCRFFAAQSA